MIKYPFSFIPVFVTFTVFVLFIVRLPVAFSGRVMVNITPSVSVTLMSYPSALISDLSLLTVKVPSAVAFSNSSSPE